MKRGIVLMCLAPVYRDLDANTLLSVIQNDQGETAQYYAKRYFGPRTERVVTQLLWSDLKKHGYVDLVRASNDAPPRWFVARVTSRRAPRVLRYRPEDHDLSVLQMEHNLGRDQEHDVISALSQTVAPNQNAALPSSGSARAFSTKSDAVSSWRHDLGSLAKEASVSPPSLSPPSTH